MFKVAMASSNPIKAWEGISFEHELVVCGDDDTSIPITEAQIAFYSFHKLAIDFAKETPYVGMEACLYLRKRKLMTISVDHQGIVRHKRGVGVEFDKASLKQLQDSKNEIASVFKEKLASSVKEEAQKKSSGVTVDKQKSADLKCAMEDKFGALPKGTIVSVLS